MSDRTFVAVTATHVVGGVQFDVRESRNLCDMEAAFWREMGRVIEERGGMMWLWLLNSRASFDVRVAAMIRLAHHTDRSMGTTPFRKREERIMFCYLLAEEAQDEADGEYAK